MASPAPDSWDAAETDPWGTGELPQGFFEGARVRVRLESSRVELSRAEPSRVRPGGIDWEGQGEGFSIHRGRATGWSGYGNWGPLGKDDGCHGEGREQWRMGAAKPKQSFRFKAAGVLQSGG